LFQYLFLQKYRKKMSAPHRNRHFFQFSDKIERISDKIESLQTGLKHFQTRLKHFSLVSGFKIATSFSRSARDPFGVQDSNLSCFWSYRAYGP